MVKDGGTGEKEPKIIHVSVSSPISEYIPQGEFDIEVLSPITAEELFSKMGERFPGLKDVRIFDHVLLTLDGRITRKEDTVKPGSTVKVFMPVFGG